MSVSYWVISGVGICAEDVTRALNRKKLVLKLLELLHDEDSQELLQSIIANDRYEEFDIEGEFLFGNPYDNMAELLVECEGTMSFTYSDDGFSRSYFYLPPTMPWINLESDPKTLEETHRRIIMAVQAITDLSAEEIEDLIDDDLYVVGEG